MIGDTLRQQAERLEGTRGRHTLGSEAMKKDGLENVHTEPVMVPQWARPESAEIVAPPLPLADHARARQQRRHAARRHRGGSAWWYARSRSSTRPRTRRDGSSSSTCRSPITPRRSFRAGPRAPRARRRCRALRSVGPFGCERRTRARAICSGPAADSGGRDYRRGCDRIARLSERGTQGTSVSRWRRSSDQTRNPQRGRRDSRPRAARRGRVVGGHFDSWDVGTGASDDGGGCVVTWEALRLMKKLDLRRGGRAGGAVDQRRERHARRQGYRDRYRESCRITS